MIEFHSFFAGEEWFFQRDKQIGWEADIIGNRHKLQYNVDGIVDLTELRFRWLASAIEHKKVKNLINLDKMLKLVNIDCNKYHIIVAQSLQQRDDRNQRTRMLGALFADVVQTWEEEADCVSGGWVLREEITAIVTRAIWVGGLKRSKF